MAFFTINDTLHQKHLFSTALCKYSSSLITSNFHYSSHLLTFALPPKISPLSTVNLKHTNARLSTTDHESSTKAVGVKISTETAPGVPSLRSRERRVNGQSVKQSNVSLVKDTEEKREKRFTNDIYTNKKVVLRNKGKFGSGSSSMESNNVNLEINYVETNNHVKLVEEKVEEIEKRFTNDIFTNKKVGLRNKRKISSGSSSMESSNVNLEINYVETNNHVKLVEEKVEEIEKRFTSDIFTNKRIGFRNKREIDSGSTSMGTNSKDSENNTVEANNISLVNGTNKNLRKSKNISKMGERKNKKGSKKIMHEPQKVQWKSELDMCSKKGDVMAAIDLYDAACKEGIKMIQYHYTVLLYLCSSAAVGVVHPAKSGSSSRSLNLHTKNLNNEVSTVNSVDFKGFKDMDNNDCNDSESNTPNLRNGKVARSNQTSRNNKKKLNEDTNDGLKNVNDEKENEEIIVSEDIKKYALKRGFEIYEKMCLENIPMNEATLTSVARMAMSMGDGDMAFDMVKQMKKMGINPRLRSYGPALSAYCSSGNSEKAFEVEKHMLGHDVYPEEPELQALLRVSIEARDSDKVYYMLHKFRSIVRKVSPTTANLIEKWFKSKEGSKVGKRKWDKRKIEEAIENGGGGWHGQGWLGMGKWSVTRTSVGEDGLCKCCEEKLVTIDLDPIETENFAESVASMAAKREKHSSFQKFQKWLDYYGPFEAVVDAANVGLYSQKRFIPSKISAVVNGIRQTFPSKKWPLIVLHNRRITGEKMEEPINKALIEKWKNADALFSTPTGSNDDWYWLYAAIKFKCLIVTNDEMRDHTFQLLGNDFFPKWKERHQVHFSFTDSGPVFHMPPPCSVVIQESACGHWHIPVTSENESEGERTWLCITRSAKSKVESQAARHDKAHTGSKTQTKNQEDGNQVVSDEDDYRNLKNIFSESVFSNNPTTTILSEIESAEILARPG